MSEGLFPRHDAKWAVCLAVALRFGIVIALVTAWPATIFAEPGKQSQAVVDIDVPAGSLQDALDKLAADTGLFFSGSGDLVKGKTTSGVTGRMAPAEALGRLLEGSGLDYRFEDVDTVTLVKQRPEPLSLNLSEIIVQGELQGRTLQETQTSVTVLTGEELDLRSDRSLRSIAERTAGVSTSARGIGFVIRGVDERGVDANGPSAPAITTSIDGARITDFGRINTTFLSTWDLEQVEILRGPQSTQSGRNALAGAVVVRSKDPSYEPEFKLRAGAGNFSTKQLAFAVNQPVIENRLAVRFSGELNDTDGFVDNITTGRDDDGRVENTTVRGAIRFDATDRLWSVFKVSHIDGYDGFASSDNAFLPEEIVATDAETSDDFRYTSGNLRFGYEFSDVVTLESETVFVDREFLFSGDFDGGPAALAAATDLAEGNSFSQEIKLLYNTERTKAVIGGFYTKTNEDSYGFGSVPSIIVAPSGVIPFLTPGSTVTSTGKSSFDAENYALFGEIDIELIDDVRLIVGGRYDREDQERNSISTRSTNDPALAPFLPVGNPEPTSTTFDAFIPKVGVVYEFTDDASLGFTYQQGYRSGGASFNIVRAQQFEFDPEFSNNYELSFRSQWPDKRLTVNANIYYVKFKDQQVVVALSNTPLDVETQNAGSSESFGGELEVRFTPIDGLDVFGAVGYNETEFTDFVSNGVQLAGNEFRNAPRWTGSIGASYYFDNGVFLSGDTSYTSGSFADAANTSALRSDSRFLVNVRAGFETDNFSVFAYVDNLTDETYIEEAGLTLSTVGPPRTFGVVTQVTF